MRSRKRKCRGVVDTSVLIAGLSGFRIKEPGRPIASAAFLRQWILHDTFVWLLTAEILAEYKEIMRRQRVRPAMIGAVINLLRSAGEQVRCPSSIGLSPDPDDDPFCACAEYGRADFIVTLNVSDFPADQLKAKVITPDLPVPR